MRRYEGSQNVDKSTDGSILHRGYYRLKRNICHSFLWQDKLSIVTKAWISCLPMITSSWNLVSKMPLEAILPLYTEIPMYKYIYIYALYRPAMFGSAYAGVQLCTWINMVYTICTPTAQTVKCLHYCLNDQCSVPNISRHFSSALPDRLWVQKTFLFIVLNVVLNKR
jgi:hypothetical protein